MRIEQRSNAGARMVPWAGPAGAATMRAAVQHRYGPPSVLELSEVGLPLPGRGDVLDQVGAASIHPGDYFVMTGEPTGVCSTRNVDLVRSLGSGHVVDYTKTDFTRTDMRYDVILDNVEARPLAAVRRARTPTGTLPNSGRGGRWLGPLGRIVKARVLSGFTRQQLKHFLSVEKRQDLLTLADLLATGQLTPVIDRIYPLDDAANALRCVAAGRTRGKVVITV